VGFFIAPSVSLPREPMRLAAQCKLGLELFLRGGAATFACKAGKINGVATKVRKIRSLQDACKSVSGNLVQQLENSGR
jgi:hypothetical protein